MGRTSVSPTKVVKLFYFSVVLSISILYNSIFLSLIVARVKLRVQNVTKSFDTESPSLVLYPSISILVCIMHKGCTDYPVSVIFLLISILKISECLTWTFTACNPYSCKNSDARGGAPLLLFACWPAFCNTSSFDWHGGSAC